MTCRLPPSGLCLRLSISARVSGVWFAGSYTTEIDSQETALTSAMNVVRHLEPQAPNLLALGG